MNTLEKTALEIVRFLRGQYRLDEVAGMFYDVPCIRFRQGGKTIVSINLRSHCYEFQIILGKKERDQFEAVRHEYPASILDIYDRQPSLHDGKWLFIPVDSPETFEPVKKLILLKKKPNRKPLPKEAPMTGSCGHRCDLCVHYTGITEEFRQMLLPHLDTVYGPNNWGLRCTGCGTDGCICHQNGNELCEQLKCSSARNLNACSACPHYPCAQATAGYEKLEPRSLSADDITWGILPYVPRQYET